MGSTVHVNSVLQPVNVLHGQVWSICNFLICININFNEDDDNEDDYDDDDNNNNNDKETFLYGI